MKKLNIGCGKDIRPGYVNVDIIEHEGVDVCCDIEKVLPFEDNSIDEILLYHVLEHIDNFDALLDEIWRIAKDEALVKIIVPYYRNKNAFTDPHHKRFFTEDTFNYWISDRKERLSYDTGSKVLFELKNMELVFPKSIISVIWHIIPIESWRNLWGFIVKEISFILLVKKDSGTFREERNESSSY